MFKLVLQEGMFVFRRTRNVLVSYSIVYLFQILLSALCFKDVGVQCSLLVPPTTAPLNHPIFSDASQSQSDTDVEEDVLDTSEYTLSEEDSFL